MFEFIVSFYAEGERMAGDCYPDFLFDRESAVAAGEWGLREYDWAVRYTIRKQRISRRDAIVVLEHKARFGEPL